MFKIIMRWVFILQSFLSFYFFQMYVVWFKTSVNIDFFFQIHKCIGEQVQCLLAVG